MSERSAKKTKIAAEENVLEPASKSEPPTVIEDLPSFFGEVKDSQVYPAAEASQDSVILSGKSNPETQNSECSKIADELKDDSHAVTNDKEKLTAMKKKPLRFSDVISAEKLKKSDSLVKYYTGFKNYRVLAAVFEFCSTEFHLDLKSSLTKFEEFVLVMIKLRLNVPNKELAFRFHIRKATVSRIFAEWINLMYQVTRALITWPNRELRIESMPEKFKNMFSGSGVAAIINCFEIPLVQAYYFESRGNTWSENMGRNTVKYLISIAPQGYVSFVSKGYGGYANKKKIASKSDLFEFLEPGDIVLADEGFSNAPGIGYAQLFTPACRYRRYQQIEEMRAQVDRVIWDMKSTFTILTGIVNFDMIRINHIDKIVSVCCALFNLTPSIFTEMDKEYV